MSTWKTSFRTRDPARRVAGTVGLLLIGSAIKIPWIKLPGLDSLRSTDLPIRFAWFSTGTYADLVIAVATVGLVVLTWAPSWWRQATGWAGAMALAIAALFFFQTRYGDYRLAFDLSTATEHDSLVTQQFGYSTQPERPASVAGVAIDSHSRLILGDMRLGYVLLILGAVVCISAASGSWTSGGRAPLCALVATILPIGVAAVLIMPEIQSNLVRTRGLDAEEIGDYKTALRDLNQATSENPLLKWDTTTRLAIGNAQYSLGQSFSPFALVANGRSEVGLPSVESGSFELDQLALALQQDPDDPVLAEEVVTTYVKHALNSGSPIDLLSLPSSIADQSIPVQYTLGRIAYRMGDDELVTVSMQRVMALTNDEFIKSSALTYIAFSQLRLGEPDQAHSTVLAAINVDKGAYNVLARSLATGLYLTSQP